MERSRPRVWPLVIAFVLVVAAIIYSAPRPTVGSSGELPAFASKRAGPADIYPNTAMTPGATNPDITQGTISETICNPHWSTQSIRPGERYTNRLKRQQIGEYGDADTDPRDYEEDHLIPLELGGNPSDPKNLWPEPFRASIADGGAHSKDKVENYLHRQVCSGAITLEQAQQQIATDWYRVYVASVR